MSDAARFFHETWLGMVQPTEGLVVSIPALLEADASERQPTEAHRAFAAFLEADPQGAMRLADVRSFLRDALGWGQGPELEDALPDALSLYVPEGPDTLRPTAALRMPSYLVDQEAPLPAPASEAARPYRLLVLELPPRENGDELDFDKPECVTGPFDYPPAKKLERLLRECRVPIGVLVHRRALRLLYAPHGEAAGHIDFRFADMAEVSGRAIYDALQLLLGRDRLFNVAEDRQLHHLLHQSRKMQGAVTTELSGQVFQALETLLKGFEAADARAGGEWLRPVMEASDDQRDPLFDALLTVLLRLVFLLYAEDAGLLPTEHPLYQKHYSLYALFSCLEAEHTKHPDSMNRRYSAWPGLLALFRLIYLGASHGELRLPAREGHLFDPNRFPFLEGFDPFAASVPLRGSTAAARAEAKVPTIDDETLYRVLRSLIYLGGSRLSYRALQVEQIGSVYEGLMGFQTLRVVAPSVRIKPSDAKTAPEWLSVEDVLAIPRAQREKWLKDHAGLKGNRGKELAKDLASLEKAHDGEALLEAALSRLERERVKDSDLAHPGRIVIQPGEERKRTSSHYTPPELSGPIVARALEPLLACMGERAASRQILSLKVCDPAMGSGAFLVEACRYLADRLVDAWTREDAVPSMLAEGLLRPGDNLTTYARGQIAERCLYGVDKNPVAVEIGKLSLWLVTLQKDKPFTFLDHALRAGDSLVGASLEQITEFNWSIESKKKRNTKGEQLDLFRRELADSLSEALVARNRIVEHSRHDTAESNREMRDAMRDSEDALSRLRLIGDVLIGAFFSEAKDKARDKERLRRKALIEAWLYDAEQIEPPEALTALAAETRAKLRPFHWMLEFPEVFYAGRVDPLTGVVSENAAHLDAIIGNPPFAGKRSIAAMYEGSLIFPWLQTVHPGAHGNADLCAHFFRRAEMLIGSHGTIGFIATNTISQGDTRTTGLAPVLANGSVIYDAHDSIPWTAGDAAVTVATLHLARGAPVNHTAPKLDNVGVAVINSRLHAAPERADAVRLRDNASLSFQGTVTHGMGFVLSFDERERLIASDARNGARIFPYLGGAEINTSPTQAFDRYVINFGRVDLDAAAAWPDLLSIVREKVLPERMRQRDTAGGKHGKKYWWQHLHPRPPLYAAIAPLERCLVIPQQFPNFMRAVFQPTDRIFSAKVVVLSLASWSPWTILQSGVHNAWITLFAGRMGAANTPVYSATDCFETFPFPKPDPRAEIPALETIGQTLYETRARFMIDTDQGLTKTYNALKDPEVTKRTEHGERIVELRALHLQMDQSVLEAYAAETGDPAWTNVEVPPFTTPETPAEKELHQRFEDHILDKLFELNAQRAGR